MASNGKEKYEIDNQNNILRGKFDKKDTIGRKDWNCIVLNLIRSTEAWLLAWFTPLISELVQWISNTFLFSLTEAKPRLN